MASQVLQIRTTSFASSTSLPSLRMRIPPFLRRWRDFLFGSAVPTPEAFRV